MFDIDTAFQAPVVIGHAFGSCFLLRGIVMNSDL
jgi:hypothetical protein